MSFTSCIRVFADTTQIRHCQERLAAIEPDILAQAAVLSLAGNDARLKILLLLSEQQLCVCDLADVLRMNVSAVSQHLRKLKDGGVIHARKVGQTVFYSLAVAQFPLVQLLLAPLATPVTVPTL